MIDIDGMIEGLERGAASAGDLAMVAICQRARLGYVEDAAACTPEERAAALAMSRAEARVECMDVIAEDSSNAEGD